MASESIAHSAFSLMGYWLTAHSGSRNNICYNKFNTWDLWGASYVQPIITHFLATWPWKSNIRLDEIAKVATWVNTNRAEEHGLLLKMGNDRIWNSDWGHVYISPSPPPPTHTCPTLWQTYAWLCLISNCIFILYSYTFVQNFHNNTMPCINLSEHWTTLPPSKSRPLKSHGFEDNLMVSQWGTKISQ